ncbi:MAG: hypothetical protein ACRDJP_13605 [Actinomycetota bacterium]
MKKNPWRLLAALFLALALVAAACGGVDEEESTGSPSAPAEEGEDGGEGEEASGEGDVEVYCEKTLAIETVPEPDIDFESMSEEEQAEAAKEFATAELQGLAQEIEAAAPEEISEDVAVLVGAVDEIAETGNFAAFEEPEVEAASDRVHEFDLENCGWERVDVTAVDYEFQGVPETVPAGAVSFEFANESEAEAHEFVLFRKNDGTTESVEDLLALGEEEAEKKITFAGATFAPPGDSDPLVAELEAGDYAAVCFIPVGATEENQEGTGPPHFTQGMTVEFTVE